MNHFFVKNFLYYDILRSTMKMNLASRKLFTKPECTRCDPVHRHLQTLGISHEIECCRGMHAIPNPEEKDLRSFPILREEDGSLLDYYEILETYDEPILRNNPDRFVLFPIQYPDLYEKYKQAEASFWVAEEVDLSKDLADWNALTENEKYYLSNILAFFAGSDGIVNENLCMNFCNEVQIPEARAFYTYQQFNETVHSETYSILLDTYIADPDTKRNLFRGIQTIPSVQKKAEWAQRWIRNGAPFAQRLVAFACVEGILFSSSFCAIYWMKKRGKLPGLCFSNSLISRDEGMHQDFATLLYRHLRFQLDTETVHRIVQEAVETEVEFVTESIPCRLIGMNSDLMVQYVQFVADSLLQDLGCEPIYHVQNPFDFMQQLDLNLKSNFFEARVSEYAKHGVMNSTAEFVTDAEF